MTSSQRQNTPFYSKDSLESTSVLKMLYEMLRIRIIEQAISQRYPEMEMRCPVHLSIGQEAVAVGVCQALQIQDLITCSHRSHGHYLAKGGSLPKMIAEIYGRATGCAQGRGGSMHLLDKEAGVLVSIAIVASSIPLGVGAALGIQQQNRDQVVVVFLGDGALEEGVFHESANFAALKKLPVIFVCENNLYSVYTSLTQRQPNRPLKDIGAAYGMPTFHGKGNDVIEVWQQTNQAVIQARHGDGPSFLIFDTYRWLEHCGPHCDDILEYRPKGELAQWKEKCPIQTLIQSLMTQGILSPQQLTTMHQKIETEVKEAFIFAQESPFPHHLTAWDMTYA